MHRLAGRLTPPLCQVVSKLWAYIRANNRQNPSNKRDILCDEKLKRIFHKVAQRRAPGRQAGRGGDAVIVSSNPKTTRLQNTVGMFEMNKYLGEHMGHEA
jgi:chromatin remodeling complex protein RSC6